MAELTTSRLLEDQQLTCCELFDTTYWLCITRRCRSRAVPDEPGHAAEHLNSFYRLPTCRGRSTRRPRPRSLADGGAGRPAQGLKIVNAAWGVPDLYPSAARCSMNWGPLGPADAVEDVVDALDFLRGFNLGVPLQRRPHRPTRQLRRPQPAPAPSARCRSSSPTCTGWCGVTGCTPPATKLVGAAVGVRVPRLTASAASACTTAARQLRREPPVDRSATSSS